MEVYTISGIKAIPLAYLPNEKNERTFEISEEIAILLPDGYLIVIPKGFKTDLSSVPSWLWSVIKPIDKALIADIIHDYLWVQQAEEIKRFAGSSYAARKYADDMRLQLRNILAPKKKLKNYLTHYVIRLVGGLFYSRQIKIPS
jgi:hypothetical protein